MTTLLRRLRVGTRFALSFGLILALTLVSGVVAYGASRAQSQALTTVEQVGSVADYAQRQDFFDASITGWQTAYAWDTTRLGVEKALEDGSDNRAGFLASRAELLAALESAPVGSMTAEEARLNERLTTNWNTFFALDDQVVAAYRDGRTALAERLILVDGWKAYQDVLAVTKDLKASVTARAAEARAHADATARTALLLILAFSASALALVVLLLYGLVRTVVTPLRELTRQAESLADGRLAEAIATIRSGPDDAVAPVLPEFSVPGRDELASLAGALNHLQSNALELAVEQHHTDRASANMLVNLGRRNQSLLTRTLAYLGDLEQDERDAGVLEKLFRLDHLSTRIRRNAESMLVLAGAQQTRTATRPTPVTTVVRAALTEIEQYPRVDLFEFDECVVLGSAAADLTHLVAELLENATVFSPRSTRVTVTGALQLDGTYEVRIADVGVGMPDGDLRRANARIRDAASMRPDSKLLGHHVVGLLADRWSVTVTLARGARAGLVATVSLPAPLLVADVPFAAADPVLEQRPAPAPAPAPAPVTVAARPEGLELVPVLRPTLSSPEPRPTEPAVVPQRVRGAQLPDTGALDEDDDAATSPEEVRRGLSGLQSGVARARRESGTATSGLPTTTEGE